MMFRLLTSPQLSFQSVRLLTLGLAGVCIGTGLGTTPSLAAPRSAPAPTSRQPAAPDPKETRIANSAQLLRALQLLFVPPQQSAPQSTSNSATRSSASCRPGEPEIQAIAPPQDYGLTLSDRPAIAVQIPATSAQSVLLTFRDEADRLHASAQLPLLALPSEASGLELNPESNGPGSNGPGTNGLGSNGPGSNGPGSNQSGLGSLPWLSFRLPASAPALSPNQRYRWSLVLVCGSEIEPDDPTFMGWIERREITPEVTRAVTSLPVQQRLRWYGQQGYWFEMVEESLPLLQDHASSLHSKG